MANIYTAALMEHNAHPDYKYDMEGATDEHEGVNPSCGDDVVVHLRVEDGLIAEVSFTGSGCAVSQASADMMADALTGTTVGRARELCGLFGRMARGEETDPDELAPLGEAACLASVARMPARVKCAELGWRTVAEMLDGMAAGEETR